MGGKEEKKKKREVRDETMLPFTVDFVLCVVCVLHELSKPSDSASSNYSSPSVVSSAGKKNRLLLVNRLIDHISTNQAAVTLKQQPVFCFFLLDHSQSEPHKHTPLKLMITLSGP